MEFRRHFTKKVWWGKFIGAFFGFLIAGPIGAIFGLLIGNYFDHGLVEHFSNPFWHFYQEKDPEIRETFFEGLFTILGHIAKSSGHVSPKEIKIATDIMQSMNLNAREKKAAQKFFNAGKDKAFNLYTTLHTVQKSITDKPNLVRLFIDTQYNFIKQTGPTIEKLDVLNNVLASLGMAPIQRQSNFYEEFNWYNTRQREYRGRNSYHQYQNNQNQSSSNNYQKSQRQTYSIEDCYAILGIQETASKEQVKKAYRKLISRNHPDKLIAKGASEKEIKEANEKTSRIRSAYEEICKLRGW